MKEHEIRARAFAMPLTNPAYPPGRNVLAEANYVIKIIPHVDGTCTTI
jgi:acetoacetate decarboxylase